MSGSPLQRLRLKYLADVAMGQSPPSTTYNSAGVGLPFLQGNADFGDRVPAPTIYCDAPTRVCQSGDLLFSVRAPIGGLNEANQAFGIGRGLCAIRPKATHLDRMYCWYLLKYLTPWIARDGVGSTYDAVTASDVGNAVASVPALAEQRAIADFLDRETAKIDALIDAKRRAHSLADEHRRAIIDAAVTGRLSDGERRQSPSQLDWLDSIPVAWAVRPLKTLARVQTGVALGRTFDGIRTTRSPYVRVANVQDGYLNLSDVAEMEIPESEVERYLLRKGDLLMNEGGDYDKLGRGAVWDGQIDPCIHQNHVFAVRAQDPAIVPWVELFNRSTVARHYFILRSKQSTNLASVSSSNLKDLPVLWPPVEERRLLLDLVRDELAKIDGRAELVKSSIELLREQRAALITAAVTGQIDVGSRAS